MIERKEKTFLGSKHGKERGIGSTGQSSDRYLRVGLDVSRDGEIEGDGFGGEGETRGGTLKAEEGDGEDGEIPATKDV